MANTAYENKVVEAKAKALLTTSVNTRNLMTVDNTLAESAGMTKTINVYSYTGAAEALTAGAGNSTRGSIKFTGTDYKVKRVQSVFDYQDEDFLKDPAVVDNGVKGANAMIVNKITSDFIAEAKKATTDHKITGNLTYDAVVDAIAKMNVEDESKLFLVIPTAWKAELRKDPDYKAAQMGEVIYNGMVGTVAGIPVIATNAVKDASFLMTKEAVRLFLKKDVEVEQDRDKDTCTNSVYVRAFYIVALVDNTQIVKITKTA